MMEQKFLELQSLTISLQETLRAMNQQQSLIDVDQERQFAQTGSNFAPEIRLNIEGSNKAKMAQILSMVSTKVD